MTPCRGNTFLFHSSSNSLVSVSEHGMAFWADTAPFKGPQPRCVRCFGTTEIQGHRQDSVRCFELASEVPGHSQEQHKPL